MSSFDPIPKPDSRLTTHDLKLIISQEELWFRKGSLLYISATNLLDALDESSESSRIVVGYSVTTEINMTSRRIDLEIMPAMLYAMAIECWLKGFIVKVMPRDSDRTKAEWGGLVHEGLDPTKIDDDYFEKLMAAYESVPARNLEAKMLQEEQAEIKIREEVLKDHKRHNLCRMADAAGLEPHLQKHDYEFLDFLSSAIETGRYPAPNSINSAVPWENVASDSSRWDSLNKAIHRRYEELL